MSAAEKLERLWTTASRREAEEVMHRSWPEIIAVLKAAEDTREFGYECGRGPLRDALSTLDEKLGAVGSAAESETPAPRRIVKANSSDLEEWKP